MFAREREDTCARYNVSRESARERRKAQGRVTTAWQRFGFVFFFGGCRSGEGFDDRSGFVGLDIYDLKDWLTLIWWWGLF